MNLIPWPAQAAAGDLRVLDNAADWLNSEPLTSAQLRGRVVLINFWTYSCINWRRTAPRLRSWDERYRERGLTIVGVHSPEFGFEHDISNVRRAAKEARLEHPLVLDNDFAIWRNLENEYWPALYFVDSTGRVRYQSFGEGNYGQSEALLQQLLSEAGVTELGEPVQTTPTGVELPADWTHLRSPETYLGHDRSERFASPGGTVRDREHVYELPARLPLNGWALAGGWTTGNEGTTSNQDGGMIQFRFSARDLHLVMGDSEPGGSTPFRVLIDGRPPGADHGLDTDADGYGTVEEPRLYQLFRRQHGAGKATLQIAFETAGTTAHVFTFG